MENPTTTLSFSESNPEAKLKIFKKIVPAIKKVLPVAQKVVTIAGVIVS
jgi:hypothetical protein